MASVRACMLLFTLWALCMATMPASTAEVATCGATPADVHVTIMRFAPALTPSSADLVDVLVEGDVTDLCGLWLDDGEGRWTANSRPVADGDRVRLLSTELVAPDDAALRHRIVWSDAAAGTEEGHLALAKGGDVVRVGWGERTLDVVVYGEATFDGPGWSGDSLEDSRIDRRIFQRGMDDAGVVDTDSAADWTFPRVYRQHQADRAAPWMTAAEVQAFVCPDRCHEVVERRLDAATSSIRFNLYDLSSRPVAEHLVAARERGVDVDVLIHDRPVGASAEHMDRIAWIVDALDAAGAEVRTLDGLRFDVNHAKYMVVDDTWTVVLSENANARGWPTDGTSGNRGWGIAVRSTELAAWMADLFDADFHHPLDALPVTGRDLHPDLQEPIWPSTHRPVEGRRPILTVLGQVPVRPVVAPDHLGDPGSSVLVDALAGARSEIGFQQLNLPMRWTRHGYDAPSPLIEAMQAAYNDGVALRGVLASSFEDGDPATPGNDETAWRLSALGDENEVVAATFDGGLYHNKGWIVDPEDDAGVVFVGSANGNLASQVMNREVDIMVRHPDVVRYYHEVLLDDLGAMHPAAPLALPVGPLPVLLVGGLLIGSLVLRPPSRP